MIVPRKNLSICSLYVSSNEWSWPCLHAFFLCLIYLLIVLRPNALQVLRPKSLAGELWYSLLISMRCYVALTDTPNPASGRHVTSCISCLIWVAKHRVTCFNVDFSACNIAMHIMSRVSLLTLIGSVLTSCLWECEEEEGTLPYGPSGSNAKSVVFSGRNWWSCFYVRTLMKCSREHSWKCVSYLPLSVFKWLFLTIFDNRNHEELTRLLASAV